MKKYLIVSALIFPAITWATGVTTTGIVHYGNEVLPSVDVKGKATMDGTTVIGDTSIKGKLEANDAHLNTLEVKGLVDLSNTLVKGKTDVKGSLHPDYSTIQSETDITTDTLTLINSTMRNIVIRPTGLWTKCAKPQTIYLNSDSTVDGDITFQCGNGLVYVTSGSSVTGKVSGGKVIYTKN